MAKHIFVWPDGRKHTVPYKQYQKAHPGHRLRPPVQHRHPTVNSHQPHRPPLTPAQKRAQRQKAFEGALGNIDRSLSGKTLIDAAHRITDADFAPMLADNQRQVDRTNVNAGLLRNNSKSYYAGLNSLLSGISTAQAGANALYSADANNRAAATQAGITANDAAARQRMAQDAAVRGAGLQGSAPADLAAATAQQQQQAAAEAQRNQIATQSFGSAQSAFLKGLQGSAAQAGGEAQQNVTNQQLRALQGLQDQRSDINTQRAGQFTDTLSKLRQQEVENAFTRFGLGIDQAKVAQAAQEARASQRAANRKAREAKRHNRAMENDARRTDRETARHNRATEANTRNDPNRRKTEAALAYFNKHGYWPPTGPPKTHSSGGGGKYGGSAKDVSSAQSGIDQAIDTITHMLGGAHGDRGAQSSTLVHGRPEQTHNESHRLPGGVTKSGKVVDQRGVDPIDSLYASIALDIVHSGHISQRNIQRLRSRGLAPSDLGIMTKKQQRKAISRRSVRQHNRFGMH